MTGTRKLAATTAILLSMLAAAVFTSPVGSATPVPTMLLGAYTTPRSGETMTQTIQRTESLIGRPLGAVRVYQNWDSAFPSKYHNWLRDTGHAIYLSVKAKRSNGTYVLYADIANAQPGSALYNDMVRWANALKGFGDHIYFIFNHEPEAKAARSNGDSTGFVAAWRKIVNVFRSQGVTNASYVWTMTDYAFSAKDARAAVYWYPGDNYVDQIGADVYNWYTCRPTNPQSWKSLAEKLEPIRRFGLQHPGKGLVLPEFGSVEDSAATGRKGSWFTDAETLFQQPGWEQFAAVMYFNTADHNYSACRWYLDSTESALSGFQQMGADPFFQEFE